MHVRTARPSDAAAMGALVARAWQAAYRGLMPDDYLDGLTVDDRADLWTRVLTGELDPPRAVFVAADHDGRIVGFVAVGGEWMSRTPRGQVYALNVDPDRWGHGVGRRCWASPLRWARSTRRCQCEIFSVAGLVEVSCSWTYQTEVVGLLANHSSIWRLTDAGWQMKFHQATPASAR